MDVRRGTKQLRSSVRNLSTGSLAEYVWGSGRDDGGWWLNWADDLRVLVFCTGFLSSSVGSSIYFKKTTNLMPNYIFAIMQTSVLSFLVFFTVLNNFRSVKKFFVGENGENGMLFRPSRSKIAFIGLLDAIAFCLAIVGGIYTKGSAQVLLMQATLPLTMLGLCTTRKTRMEFMQVIGAMVVVVGIYVVMSQATVMASSDSLTSQFNPLLFSGLFVLSTAPASLANVLRAQAFHEYDNTDLVYTYAWKCIFQLLFGVLLVPVNLWTKAVSLPQGVIHTTHGDHACDELPGVLSHIACRVASVSLEPSQLLHYIPPCRDCTDSGDSLPMFVMFSLLQSLFAFLLYRHTPASVPFLVSAVRAPFVIACFRLLPGEALRVDELPGLVIVLIGVALFRMEFPPDSERFTAGFTYNSAPFLGPGIHEPFVCQVSRKIRGPSNLRVAPPVAGADYSAVEVTPEAERCAKSAGKAKGRTGARDGGNSPRPERNAPSPLALERPVTSQSLLL